MAKKKKAAKKAKRLTKSERELLYALSELLRVSQGGEYDHKDTIGVHYAAERVIDKYSPAKCDY